MDRRAHPESGNKICESRSPNVPAWGMYLAGIVASLLGLPILIVSVPSCFGRLNGDFEAGAAQQANHRWIWGHSNR